MGRTVRSSSTRASLPLSELVHRADMDADTYADDPPQDVLVCVQTVRVHSMEKVQEMKNTCRLHMCTEIREETSSGCRAD